MHQITIEQLHELYIDTAKRGSSAIVSLIDEEIEYNLFEEFDVGVRSFFHDDCLNKLVQAGMIGEEAVLVSQEIRRRWLALDETSWTIREIKSHPNWKRLFAACDRLLTLLKTEKGRGV